MQTTRQALSALDLSAQPLPLAVFHLRGSERDMGAQHGRLLRQVGGWEATAAYYGSMVEQMIRGSAILPQERALPILARPLLNALTRRMEKHRPAELRGRTDAFLQACGQHPGESRHWLAMDVFQNAVGLAGRYDLGPFSDAWMRRAVPACSTLMAWGEATVDGRLLHGRNFDFPGVGVWDAAPAVVFCTPDKGLRYAFATTRGGDTPGVSAWNEAGLTVTPHTRLHREVSFSGAGVVDLCHDIARKASTLAEAEAIVRERTVSSTWGLSISSAAEGRAAVIECHAGGVAVTGPQPGNPWRTCTNHYLSDELRHRELAPSPGWTWHSHSRLKRLEQAATQARAGQPLDVPGLFAWLGDGRDADEPGMERVAGGVLAQATSVQSVVSDPQRRQFHVSVGRCPTGRGGAFVVDWDWDQPVGVEELPIDQAPVHAAVSRFDSGPAQMAHRHYLRAAQLEAQGGDPHEVGFHLATAAELLPDEPTLQLMGGAVALRRGKLDQALALFERGISVEYSGFPLGRLHYWAARTADHLPDRPRAQRHRQALLALEHPLLRDLQGRARDEANKLYPLAKLRGIGLHTLLGDIG